MNTNPSMTFSILVLYCPRFHQSLLKSWPIKFTSSNLEVLMHCHKSFQTSAAWKEARSCSGRGQEGISKVRRPRVALRRPFLCMPAAPRDSSTCSYTFLLASIVYNCCQKLLKREGWDKSGQGTRKAGVWQLASQMWGC